MSLRTRLAVVVALTVFLTAGLVIAFSHFFAQRELLANLDSQLKVRATSLFDQPRGGGRGRGSRDRGDADLQLVAGFAQIIGPNGDVVISLSNAPEIPVDERDIALAQSADQERFRSLDIDGARYRVITKSFPRGAIQVAISQDSMTETLEAFDRRLLMLGAVGVVMAGLAGWLIADRISRPIEGLASAANAVAETKDFSRRINLDRSDEVGDLATSFDAMLEALEESKRQQHQLVQDASHELRTPLTSVRTNVDVLKGRIDEMDSAQRDAILGDLQTEVGELSSLVGELVDLATDTSDDVAEYSELDLFELCQEVADRFARLHGREIVVTGNSAAPVEGDAESIERAVVNLITNAIKFSPDDTAIAIVVGEGSIEVSDEGPGIPDADLDRIFDRFYRADETRTLPGSGLGLAIVAQTAERHGGKAWARNNPTGGATVGFNFWCQTRP
ncbi:MAG: HAMP domain-containing sensor histidine kinase [Acidimicrobiales bacterium]